MEQKIRKNDYYIYNFAQINWMLQQGCQPEEVGKGFRGDLYVKFSRTQETETIVNSWKTSKRM